MFYLNTLFYTRDPNVFDSYAEGFEKIGENDSAILNYERAIELDPTFQHARERLDFLIKLKSK